MISVKAPRFDINDDKVKLVQWLVHEGDQVEVGMLLCIVETSKATFDVLAERAGILSIKAIPGEQYSCDDVLGNIFENKKEFLAYKEGALQEQRKEIQGEVVLSKGAQKLILEKGITQDQIKALGKQVIREADILSLLSEDTGLAQGSPDPLSRHQRMVAQVVMKSHREIPAAFVALRVYGDRLLAGIAQMRTQKGVIVGIAEFLIYSLGRLSKKYPSFYGKYVNDHFIPAGEDCSVGVTFDVGHGLFVPRMPQAANRPLQEIITWLATARMKALRNNFKQEDLELGDISISLNADKDVEFVVPFIFPPQVCIVSVGSIFEEWSQTTPGNPPMARKYFLLGVAYDHRINNGSKATQFAQAIKRILEEDIIKEMGIG